MRLRHDVEQRFRASKYWPGSAGEEVSCHQCLHPDSKGIHTCELGDSPLETAMARALDRQRQALWERMEVVIREVFDKQKPSKPREPA